MKAKVAIVTSMPRTERVHVYNEMARLAEIEFRVFYLRRMAYGRLWSEDDLPSIKHDAIFIPEKRLHKHLYLSPGLMSEYRKYGPTLMVMTQYASIGMQGLMWLESYRKIPWVFWSEPPYVRFNDAPIIPSEHLANLMRGFAMIPLRRWTKEIWATGTRAVAEYRKIALPHIPVKNLPYYSDLDRFFEASKQRVVSSCVRFFFCGTLSKRKSADTLAQAVEELSNDGLAFELLVAGDGPLRTLFDNLSESARDKVRLLGFVPPSQLPGYYAETDVLLFPSRYDGWGMTLPEGMASGQPVVSTAQTGSAIDLIRDGENGFLLQEPDRELTNAMRWFIAHPEQISIMGQTAQATIQSYTHRVGARQFTDMLTSVISQL